MAFQLKITLLETAEPQVWRRIIIDDLAPFEELHLAIQGAFGWEIAHLWEFTPTLGRSNMAIVMPDMQSDWLEMESRELIEADMIGLEEFFLETGDKMYYQYDFGDSWYHEIRLEAVIPDEEMMYEVPQVIEGKGACPPEDCGGAGGYAWIRQVLQNPDHEEYDHYRQWMGLRDDEEFDPHYFDLEITQEDITNLFDTFEFDDELDDEDDFIEGEDFFLLEEDEEE